MTDLFNERLEAILKNLPLSQEQIESTTKEINGLLDNGSFTQEQMEVIREGLSEELDDHDIKESNYAKGNEDWLSVIEKKQASLENDYSHESMREEIKDRAIKVYPNIKKIVDTIDTAAKNKEHTEIECPFTFNVKREKDSVSVNEDVYVKVTINHETRYAESYIARTLSLDYPNPSSYDHEAITKTFEIPRDTVLSETVFGNQIASLYDSDKLQAEKITSILETISENKEWIINGLLQEYDKQLTEELDERTNSYIVEPRVDKENLLAQFSQIAQNAEQNREYTQNRTKYQGSAIGE